MNFVAVVAALERRAAEAEREGATAPVSSSRTDTKFLDRLHQATDTTGTTR